MIPSLLLLLIRDDIRVADLGSLRAAVSQAKPGTRIVIAAGDYAGGVYAMGVNGTSAARITITGEDPKKPPVFHGAWQLQGSSYVSVQNIAIVGVTGNAIGIDDGGVREKPSAGMELAGIHISDNPGGGSSGIKCAGVDEFSITGCYVQRYGGCGIDMVGCHKVRITDCRFEHGGALGIQAKGASSSVVITKCTFRDAGPRGVNLGGSTGNPFYRPPIESMAAGSRYEAKDVTVQGCTFEASDAPIAFAGAIDCVVRFNTFVNPLKWAIRILQETATPDFAPCRDGRFEDNVVMFRSSQWYEGGVNVGPNTKPDSFHFARNWWFCSDRPDRSKPILPSTEKDGHYGSDPMVLMPEMRLDPQSPAKAAGAGAFLS